MTWLELLTGAIVLAAAAYHRFMPDLRGRYAIRPFAPFRGWEMRPHPGTTMPVWTGWGLPRRAPVTPGMGAVLVRVAIRSLPLGRKRFTLATARPQVPVVYADGYPVAYGWGDARFELTPGPHLIAVASGHSRCYRHVEILAGTGRALVYEGVVGAQADRYATGADAWIGADFDDPAKVRRRSPRRDWAAGIVLALYTAAIAARAGGLITERLAIGIAVCAALVMLLVVGVFALTGAGNVGAGTKATVAADAWKWAPPAVRDADRPEAYVPAPGRAGLGLRLRFSVEPYERADLLRLNGSSDRLGFPAWWRSVRLGEPRPSAFRPWFPAPRVELDGVPVSASWTRMWFEVAPGEHEVRVTVGAAPAQVGRLERTEETRVFRVTAVEGATAEVDVHAAITAVPHPERVELQRFSVALEAR